jgi:PAS domain S-box-containing protein
MPPIRVYYLEVQPVAKTVLRFRSIAVSLTALLIAGGITFALRNTALRQVPFAFFFAAVAVSAWQAGWLAGILVGVGGVVIVNIAGHFAADQLLPSAILILVSIIISLLSASRDRADRSLRRSETRHAAIVDAALDCIISINHKGQVIEWNPAAENVFGFDRAEAMGREMAELIIPPKFREAHRNGLSKYLQTGEGSVIGKRLELTALKKDGTEIPVELAITRVPLPGIPTFTGHLRDISDRKAAEQERIKLLEAEREARADAERTSRIKDEFLATLSHELRTPLNAILGWSQILKKGDNHAEDLTEGLMIIERNARAQTQLIEDLLDMSRIISGKIRLDVQQFELSDAVVASIETVKSAAATKGIKLQSVLDPLTHPVSGDPNRMQQVFWNLLSNAVKFTPKGGRIQVRVERVNSHVEVSVTDSGEGIPPEFLPYVFDRFRQADSTTTRHHGGLGLGLSIVKHLTELHGGSVSVKSPGVGGGSTFTVVFPLTPIHPSAETVTQRRHPQTRAVNIAPDTCVRISGVKVLVVDDEPDARALVRRLLEDCDAVVTTVDSAAEAMQQMQQNNFQVLVSDIGMPGDDGYALIKQIRTLPADRGRTIPAIALTAYARSEDRVKSVMAGFDMHLPKPVEPTELIAMVAVLATRKQ